MKWKNTNMNTAIYLLACAMLGLSGGLAVCAFWGFVGIVDAPAMPYFAGATVTVILAVVLYCCHDFRKP